LEIHRIKAIYLTHPGGFNAQALEKVRSVPGLELTEETAWNSMEPGQLADRIRDFDILLLSRAPGLPDSLGENPGKLKWICYLHGGMKDKIGLSIIRSSIQVTNWGDAPAVELAEGSLVLLMCCLKDVHFRVMEVRRNRSRQNRICSVGGTVNGLRVGVYGYGYAGKAFVKMVQPLGAELRIFDPYASDLPDGCIRVDSLEELFEGAHAIVVHAALTPETQKSITADLLAKLPDQGIVVNTARGAIFDQDALFAELKAGRLRAGLDVLSPDHLPEDHEARSWDNLIYGAHCFSQMSPWPGENSLSRRDVNVLENLHAFVQGLPLKDVIDERRYSLMT
jgi:phosphoglycerate dehydrogenase-like enzyme